MAYGVGTAADAMGGFGQGVRAAREYKMQQENEHLDKLYQRYKLSQEQQANAQARYDHKIRMNQEAERLNPGQPPQFDTSSEEGELQNHQDAQKGIVNQMEQMMGGSGKQNPKGKVQHILNFFGLFDQYGKDQGVPPGQSTTTKTQGTQGTPNSGIKNVTTPPTFPQPVNSSAMRTTQPPGGSVPISALPYPTDTSKPNMALPQLGGKDPSLAFPGAMPRDNSHADLVVGQTAPAQGPMIGSELTRRTPAPMPGPTQTKVAEPSPAYTASPAPVQAGVPTPPPSPRIAPSPRTVPTAISSPTVAAPSAATPAPAPAIPPQPYQWSLSMKQAADAIQRTATQGQPITKFALGPSFQKDDEASKKRFMLQNAAKIVENLQGYLQHVKQTPGREDDTLEAAQRDPEFNKGLGAMRVLEESGLIHAGTIESFLRQNFADYRSNRPPLTAEQAMRDEHFKNSKDYPTAIAGLKKPTEGKSLADWNAGVRNILLKRESGQALSAEEEAMLKADTAYVERRPSPPILIPGTGPTGQPEYRWGNKGKSTTTRINDFQPPRKDIPVDNFVERRPAQPGKLEQDPVTKKWSAGSPKPAATVYSADKIWRYFKQNPNTFSLNDVQSLAATPGLFDADPNELKKLNKYIDDYMQAIRRGGAGPGAPALGETEGEEEEDSIENFGVGEAPSEYQRDIRGGELPK